MPIDSIIKELQSERDKIDQAIKALTAVTVAPSKQPETQAHYVSSGPEEDRGSATSKVREGKGSQKNNHSGKASAPGHQRYRSKT